MTDPYRVKDPDNLAFIVERLLQHDRQRVLRLIDLFRQAPEDVRELARSRLRQLIASEPKTYAELALVIDEIIEYADRAFHGPQKISRPC